MFKIGNIEINSLINENLNFSNEVTSKAVESGAEIADNIKHNPMVINATCVMAGTNAMDRYRALKELANQDVLVTYYGSLEPSLPNMAIESVSPKRDTSYGNGFEFDITLRQVTIAQLQTFQILATADKATGKKVEGSVTNTGRKQTQTQTVDVASIKSRLMAARLGET